MIYLASPYSHPDPNVREERFQAVCKFAAAMMAQGEFILSPIAHTHPIALAGALPTEWVYWERFDTELMQACSKVVVLKLDGWETSVGIHNEINLALRLGKPVEYAEPFQG